MISRKERKEIAQKLREDGLRLDQSDMSTIRQAFVAIDKGIEAPCGREFSLLFDRLADLIDPTCKPVEVSKGVICSECLNDIYDDDLYCSRCGSRVVRRNGQA